MKRIPFFVYGTLLSGQPNAGAWGDAVSSRSPARFLNGELADFGAFPMLVEGGHGFVVGETVEVAPAQYEEIVRRLDRLEKYDPETDGPGPYRRAARLVLLDDGRIVESWVYLGQSHYAAGRPRVPGGDWRRHTNQ